MSAALVPESVKQEVLAMEVTFTAEGVRREDGRTAAQVEADLAATEEDNGAE